MSSSYRIDTEVSRKWDEDFLRAAPVNRQPVRHRNLPPWKEEPPPRAVSGWPNSSEPGWLDSGERHSGWRSEGRGKLLLWALLEVEWVNFGCKSDFEGLLAGIIMVLERMQTGYA